MKNLTNLRMRQSNRSTIESRNESSVDDSVSCTSQISTAQHRRVSVKENHKESSRESLDRYHQDLEKLDDQGMNFDGQEGPSAPEEVQQLRDIKANYEVELETSAEKITLFKETIVELREENNNLRRQLIELKNNNHGQIVKDLEEECNRWENLYYQSAELGAARMSRLEAELEQLRNSSLSDRPSTSDSTREQINNLSQALKYTFESAQAKEEELKDYKQKSKHRLMKLSQMLEKVKAEKQQVLEEQRLTEQSEQALLVHIEDLEAEVKAKTAIIERERNQAAKRETRLREQIRKLQKTVGQRKSRDKVLDSACSSMASVFDLSLDWCLPQGKIPQPQ